MYVKVLLSITHALTARFTHLYFFLYLSTIIIALHSYSTTTSFWLRLIVKYKYMNIRRYLKHALLTSANRIYIGANLVIMDAWLSYNTSISAEYRSCVNTRLNQMLCAG